MVKRLEDLTPGDCVLTPDQRRWRVVTVERLKTRVGFLARQDGGTAMFAADVTILAWSEDHQTWIVGTRPGPFR